MESDFLDETGFITQLTACQSRLYGYILTLTGDTEQSRDILQDANIVICNKAKDYQPGTNFIAWVFRIAYFQAKSYLQKIARERVVFDESLLDQMSEKFDPEKNHNIRHEALNTCIGKLPQQKRELIRLRYESGRPVKAIAELLSKSPNAVSLLLHRVHIMLLNCIQKQLKSGETA